MSFCFSFFFEYLIILFYFSKLNDDLVAHHAWNAVPASFIEDQIKEIIIKAVREEMFFRVLPVVWRREQ